MESSANNSSEIVTLEVIAQRKKALLKEIKKEQATIKRCTGDLFAPVHTASRTESLIHSFSSGFAVVDGVLFGLRMMKQIRRFFSK